MPPRFWSVGRKNNPDFTFAIRFVPSLSSFCFFKIYIMHILIRCLGLLMLSVFFVPAFGQIKKSDRFQQSPSGTTLQPQRTTPASSSGLGAGLSNNEIAGGLKEALVSGAKNAAGKLSATDGYFRNMAVKILLPPEAQQVEQTLRSIGMGSLVDDAVLAMNRAAEDAAKKAAPIFVDAITGMSIQDGIGILRGGNTAATQFLQNRTTNALTSAFKPVIQNSLNQVGATRIWETVFTTYNQLPLIREKVNPDLSGYVTQRALDGLFKSIADEELKIRTNPVSRGTELLQKVFGR